MVISCLHSPDDVHSKFDACPPCFFAVYDGHNGDLAAEIAKSKVTKTSLYRYAFVKSIPLRHTVAELERKARCTAAAHSAGVMYTKCAQSTIYHALSRCLRWYASRLNLQYSTTSHALDTRCQPRLLRSTPTGMSIPSFTRTWRKLHRSRAFVGSRRR